MMTAGTLLIAKTSVESDLAKDLAFAIQLPRPEYREKGLILWQLGNPENRLEITNGHLVLSDITKYQGGVAVVDSIEETASPGSPTPCKVTLFSAAEIAELVKLNR